jgi:hypothetical protein
MPGIKSVKKIEKLIVKLKLNMMHFKISMKLPYAGACSPIKPDDGGLGAGSVLLIIFFVVLAVYLGVGITYNVFVAKRSGTSVIPNYKFWSLAAITILVNIFFIFNKYFDFVSHFV